MFSCSCPAATALTDIPAVDCPENVAQIQKAAFQRLYGEKAELNGFDSAGEPQMDITQLSAWTSALAALTGGKVVVSPYLQNPTSEPGAARQFGGGNETLGGIPITIGSEPTTFTAVLRSIPQSVIAAMKPLMCESQAHNLGVYLFNENGQIICLKDKEKESKYLPIPIESLFISDKGLGGFEAPDSNNISWSFNPNWSDNLVIVTPKFNPLTLAPAK